MRACLKAMIWIVVVALVERGTVGDVPRYPVYRLAATPELDGRVETDAAWAGVPGGVGFHVQGGRQPLDRETSFRMGCTDEALYVGFVCGEPDMGQVEANAQDDNPAIWKEDGVEVFVLPKDGDTVFQVIANAGGARMNYRTPVSDLEMGGAVRLEQSRAAAFRGPDFYSVEIEIPFATLGRKPGDGEVWNGNLCRNVNLGEGHKDENFAWAHTVQGYCDPDRFAELVFHHEPAAAAGVAVDALAITGDDVELHLVVSLSFDEGSGDVAHGQSAIVNDGRIVGADWRLGRFGQALDFAEDGDRVEVPHSESLKGITAAFTLECWAYFNLDKLSGTTGTLIAKAAASGFGNGYFLEYSDSKNASRQLTLGIAQDWGTRIWLQADEAIKTAGWHHVLATYDSALTDGARGKMYVDGVLVSAFDQNITGINPSGLPLTVGSRLRDSGQPELGMGYTFKGGIDEVKVWDKALNAEEIEQLYGALWAKSKPLSPAASEMVRDGKPQFTWTASGDGTGYVCELADVPDFSTTAIARKAQAETRFTVVETLEPGVYYWRVWSTDKAGAPTAASAPCAFIVPWEDEFEAADTTPPVITDVKPVLDTTAASARPEISARWRDDHGVAAASARLSVDGKDVTAKATVTAEGISFRPGADLAQGVHRFEVSVRDAAGNPANQVRQAFAVGEPYRVVVKVRTDGRTTINGEPFFPIMLYHTGLPTAERMRIGS